MEGDKPKEEISQVPDQASHEQDVEEEKLVETQMYLFV